MSYDLRHIHDVAKIQAELQTLMNRKAKRADVKDVLIMLSGLEVSLPVVISTRIGSTLSKMDKQIKMDTQTRKLLHVMVKQWSSMIYDYHAKRMSLKTRNVEDPVKKKPEHKEPKKQVLTIPASSLITPSKTEKELRESLLANDDSKKRALFKLKSMLEEVMEGKGKEGQAEKIIIILSKMDVTAELLKKTQVGITLRNASRTLKLDTNLLVTLEETMVRWRKMVITSQYQEELKIQRPNIEDKIPPKDETQMKILESLKQPRPIPSTKAVHHKLHFSSRIPIHDAIRMKSRSMIMKALKTPFPHEIEELIMMRDKQGFLDPQNLAARIEEVVFRIFGNTDSNYRTRVRSRVYNLQDEKNPVLRLNILLGMTTPSDFAQMDSFEMASAQLKEFRNKIKEETTRGHEMIIGSNGGQGLEKCPKCNKYNTIYNQVQTLSGDEPITTFCYCNDCSNRWRFN